jgi:hypothetical protein
MKNVTLSIDERILEASREYALRHGTTLNAMIREFLESQVAAKPRAPLAELWDLMDKHPIKTSGPWRREELYDL